MNERAIAAENGELLYSTDRPCRKGHIGNRYTSNGMCVACLQSHASKFKAAKTERTTKRLDGFRPCMLMLLPAMHADAKRFGDLLRNGNATQIQLCVELIDSMLSTVVNPVSSSPPLKGPMEAEKIIVREALMELFAVNAWETYEQSPDNRYVKLDGFWFLVEDIQQLNASRKPCAFSIKITDSEIYQ